MVVPVHTAFGTIALAAGALNLLLRKGTGRHRLFGWVYAGAMYALLVTSFFIFEAYDHFGIFHVLSLFSGVTLTVALYFPLRRWKHRHWMAHHYIWISYSYIGLVMATGSHLIDALPGWPFAVRAFVFWGLPWIGGTIWAFGWMRRIVDGAAATLVTVSPDRSPEAQRSHLFPNDLPRLTLAQMAAEVLRWLDSHPSLGINRLSRIYSLCQTVVSNAGRVSERGEPHYVLLEQSFKDVQELWLITRVLGDDLLEPFFKEPFIRAGTNDSKLPEDSGDLTRGRDTQFELFVGAIGRCVGFDVSHLGEGQPDWLMSTGTRAWTVETKRAKSAKAVNRLSEKAAKQIERSLVGGVIVIDVSVIGGADQRRLVRCITDEELADAREQMGNAILNDGLPQIMKAIGDVAVGLIIFHDFVIRPAGKRADGEEVPWGLHGLWWAYHLEAPDSSQRDRYEEFWELFGRGLPDL